MTCKRLSILMVTVFLLVSLVSGCDLWNDEKEKYSISGQVIDDDGQGMEGVSLFIKGFGVAETDEEGFWSKKGLHGSVAVTPAKDGYLFEPGNRKVEGERNDVDFEGVLDDDDWENGFTDQGDQESFSVQDWELFMRRATGGTFPMGMGDLREGNVDHDFWIAENLVTYELWYYIKTWAEEEGYTFENEGREGSHGDTGEEPSEAKHEPVTNINWFDSIVWCNALSEYKGYNPVYTANDEVIKDATAIDEENLMVEDENGFRLPTSMEWELAARHQGQDPSYGGMEYPSDSGRFWTPGNYASGGTRPAWFGDFRDGIPGNEEALSAVAWYNKNSDVDDEGRKTQDVGQKPQEGNGLGLFDMSGNVWEWCCSALDSQRVVRGGSWRSGAGSLQIGFENSADPEDTYTGFGFRFVRTDS